MNKEGAKSGSANSSSSKRPVTPRQRHLSKGKPPSLTERKTQQLQDMQDLGSTEPHLKKYKNQDQPSGSKFFRFVIGAFLAFITIVIIGAILILFVPAVNKAVVPYLPPAIQEIIDLEKETTATPAPTTSVPDAVNPTESPEPISEEATATPTPETVDTVTPEEAAEAPEATAVPDAAE